MLEKAANAGKNLLTVEGKIVDVNRDLFLVEVCLNCCESTFSHANWCRFLVVNKAEW